MHRWWVLLLVAVWAAPAAAEMDAAEYQVDEVIGSTRERDKVKDEIASAIEREAEQARRDADEQARLRAEAEAAEARRPYPERLLTARCMPCHPAHDVFDPGHTLLGWHVVVARMRWLNGAPVAGDEHSVLAAELARRYPAAPADAWFEYGAALGTVAAPLLLGWAWRRWRHTQARTATPGA